MPKPIDVSYLSDLDLALLQQDLRQRPENRPLLDAVLLELARRLDSIKIKDEPHG
jgi:hypothetical protein